MKVPIAFLVSAALTFLAGSAGATQADDTAVNIISQSPGASPFIAKLTLSVSNLSTLDRMQFTITPKAGSVTRPLSATYSKAYLSGRGFVDPPASRVTLPVFGLYDGYTNRVRLTYYFKDGSKKQATTNIPTAAFDDACDYNTPRVLQARTGSTALSYDYILIGSNCGNNSPTVIDTDGAVRWVGTAGVQNKTSEFFDGAIYQARGPQLLRIELDGAVTVVGDYSSIGVRGFHHNIDYGKDGLLLGVSTHEHIQTVLLEVDRSGVLKKKYDMVDIITQAMIEGGDDPSEFVRPLSQVWFHNNSAIYRKADDSVVISSRENFVICLDHDTGAIKWILGDPRKKWYQYPSLRRYALNLAPGTIPPSGQHTVSIGKDGTVMVMDNGTPSLLQQPSGPRRQYAASRKYKIDLVTNTATEVWRHEDFVIAPFCSSVYEHAPGNYLIDYAPGFRGYARILGVDSTGEKVFEYSYPTAKCEDAYKSVPLSWHDLSFPPIDTHLANISARSDVQTGDRVAIDGFIIAGSVPKKVVLRGLGPSLQFNGQPLSGRLLDPRLELHSSTRLLQINDNYRDSANAAAIAQLGLAPADERESAILATLAPGAYTTVLRGVDNTTGVGLAEVYDVDPGSASQLANLSARAFSSSADNVLIGGLILQGTNFKRFLFRALGPSLAQHQIGNPLPDPVLDLYDSNGVLVATNDNWRDAANVPEIEGTGAQPGDDREAAILMPLSAGAYTFVAHGKEGASGTALVEAYRLD